MLLTIVAFVGALVAQADAKSRSARESTAADIITLKDGAAVRGQIVNMNDHGKLVFVVRRAWANENLPEQAKTWRDFESPWLRRARSERLQRLERWQSARRRLETDPLAREIQRSIDHLKSLADDDELPPLMMVAIDRREIKKTERRPENLARLLRLAWRTSLPDAETMSLADLRAALESRNVLASGDDPVSIDDLLPMPIESEPQWMLRRAATEVQNDKAVWFASYEGALIPEGSGAQGLNLAGMLPNMMRQLTGEGPPRNPIPDKLKSIAASGAAGAVITQLEFLPDFAGVQVESTLWVRVSDAPDDWKIGLKADALVRSDQARGAAEETIKNDPQVQGIFNTIEGLGLGQIDAELKQRALAIGAATQIATSRAKESLNTQIGKFANALGTAR